MSADKLGIGIPMLPTYDDISSLVEVAGNEDFIRSCYVPMEVKKQYVESEAMAAERADGKYVLRRDLSKEDKDKLWSLLDATGRNDVRISTVIDYKMESGEVQHVYQLINAKVVGTVNSPDPLTNYNIAYIPLDVMQDEAGMMLEGHITELIIRDKKMTAADMTSKIEKKDVIIASLNTALAAQGQTIHSELDVYQWEDYSEDYFGHESMEYGSTQMFSIILFFLAFIGISNTMLLAILERGKEIGMMRAMGMTDGQLVITYILEAGFLGFIGSALGIVAGCMIIYPLVKNGVDFSAMIEQMDGNIGYRIAGNARAAWRPTVIIGTGIVAVLLSAFMAWMPTRRATKLAITDSLRFE
jgi:ABC-type antimicrobial peptide transport system permease subunit